MLDELKKPVRATLKVIFSDFHAVARIWREIKLRPSFIVVPPIFSILTILCEYAFIAFLYPLVQGLIYGKVNFQTSPRMLTVFFKHVADWLNYPSLEAIPVNHLMYAGITLLLTRYFLMFLNNYIALMYSQLLAHETRMRIAERELHFGHQYFERMKVGQEISVLTHVYRLTSTIQHLKELILQTFLLTGYFFILVGLIGKWSLLVLLIMGSVNSSTRYILRRIKKDSEVDAKQEHGLYDSFYNLLSTSPLIKAYNHENRSLESFRHLSNGFIRTQTRMFGKKAFLNPFQEALLILLILLGFQLVITFTRDYLPKENLVAVAMTVFVILKRMASNLQAISDQRTALSSLEGALNNVLRILSDDEKYYVPSGSSEFNGFQNGISIRNLSFTFDGQRTILNKVNLAVNKGETLALVGATGSGKSTLAKLIQRFYDCPPDSIFFDDKDIRDFSLSSIRAQIAHISQDVIILNDTIRMNVLFGLENISETQLTEAITKARLGDLIKKLPQGLETAVGERGTRLSGGEKQRIAMARAILKPCSLVILDEATSALDSITELAVQEAVDETLKEKTAIVIAHRLSTVLKANRVAVMHEGQIVELGTVQELLDLKGYFYELWTTQQLRSTG